MTTSEAARHVRAELETIAAGLQLHELARLVALGRHLLLEAHDGGPAGGRSDSDGCVSFERDSVGFW